ncbi:inositol 1,4,5-trisphosphate receptor-interacting protein [Brachyhypopomus gauderio]|uniref:inositol 1,4,5-trisphosphate receptor-interacting protein n=1 Tax=Brachyhypopomus gauderio TaxID=698409 RepID=UPI004042C426
MEEVFLRMCVVLVSLLCLDDYTVIEKVEDDLTTGVQELKHYLHEEARSEQSAPTVTMELPHSEQEMSQSYRGLAKEESDVLQILPNVKEENTQERQMPPKEDEGMLHPQLLMENNLENTQTDKVAPLLDEKVSQQSPSVKQAAEKQNYENQIMEIQATPALSNKTHSDLKNLNLAQMGTTANQMHSEGGSALPHEEHGAFFLKIYEYLQTWSQTSGETQATQDDESTEDTGQSRAQMHKRTGEIVQEEAPDDRRNSRGDQGEALNYQEQVHRVQVASNSIENAKSDNTHTWYLWRVLSLISLIRLLRKFLGRGLKTSGTIFPTVEDEKKRSASAKLSLPDHDVLSCFYDQCVRVPPNTCEQTCEFVEGFVDELLEVVRRTSDKDTEMQIEDFVGVGSLYEFWATGKKVVCDLYVSFTAPRSHTFGFELWKDKNGASNVAGCGKIKMMKTENTLNSCPCSSGNLDDDLLCLLHPHNGMTRVFADATGGPLCQENKPYLSKARVVRWFRAAIRRAWEQISHKYEFELAFRNQTAPGALKVRFRSGQVILFNITPVVQVKGSNVHLVSYLSTNRSSSDIDWPVSFALYEKDLLQQFDKTIPYNSCHIKCLRILSFLHKQQISLTGKCGLTSYHLKTALIHLLLAKKPSSWKCEHLTERLIDMLMFLEDRLQAKELHHALLGNPLLPSHIGLPKELQVAQPTNLLLPLVLNKDSYIKTIRHLQELVRNSPVLICEYISIKCPTGELKAKASF